MPKSHASRRTTAGRFTNQLPTVQGSMREMWTEWRGTKAPTEPSEPVPVERRAAADFESPPETGLRVTWLGHATMILEIGGRRLLTDPVWAERASPFQLMGPRRFHPPPLPLEELPPLDAVLLTHDHYDHLDRAAVTALARIGVPFIVPLEVGRRLRRWGVSRRQIREVDWWEEVDVHGVTVTATPSRHFSGRSPMLLDRNRTLWCGFALTTSEHRLYYVGDSALFDGFDEIGAELGPFDATLVEIGAYNQLWPDLHLGPEQAVDAFHRVRGGLMIPIHWATFDLSTHGWTEPVERFLVEARRTDAPHVVLRPGQRIEPARPPAVERWWPELPWRTVEEYPVVSSGVTPLDPRRLRPPGLQRLP